MHKLIGACGLLFLTWSLHADTTIVLYDSMDGETASQDGIAFGLPLADSFSTDEYSGPITQITLMLQGLSDIPGSISVELYGNGHGTSLGADLGTLGTIDDSVLPLTTAPIVLDVASSPVLQADTRYWIALTTEPDNITAGWGYTFDTTGTGVEDEYFQDGIGLLPNDPSGPYQMEVEIDDPDIVTPEPGTLLLAGSALVAIGLTGRRKKKNR
jgi:hypothetical protein